MSVVIGAIVGLGLGIAAEIVMGSSGDEFWGVVAGILFFGPGAVPAFLFGLGLLYGKSWAEWVTTLLALPAAGGGFVMMALVNTNDLGIAPIETWFSFQNGVGHVVGMIGFSVLVLANLLAFVTAVAALTVRAARAGSRPFQPQGPSALPAT